MPDFPLYPTAFAFVKEVQRQVEDYFTQAEAQDASLSLKEYLRTRNMCKPENEEVPAEGQKEKKWNFYTFGGRHQPY